MPADHEAPALADQWRRVVAMLLDAGVIAFVTNPWIIFALIRSEDLHADPSYLIWQLAPWTSLGLVPLLIYAALLEGGERGASIGKRAMGIAVCDAETYGPIGPGRAAGRRLIFLLLFTFLLLPGFANVVAAVMDANHQGWHDKAVKTLVIRGAPVVGAVPEPGVSSEPAIFRRPAVALAVAVVGFFAFLILSVVFIGVLMYLAN